MNVKRSKPTWTWSNASASSEMKAFVDPEKGQLREVLANCSQTDFNSFVLSFMHLETTISTCFTQKIMQSGWAKAGLIGLELHQVMSHWIGITPHHTSHPKTPHAIQAGKCSLPRTLQESWSCCQPFFMKLLKLEFYLMLRCRRCSLFLMSIFIITQLTGAF